jgi:hypothetical protein
MLEVQRMRKDKLLESGVITVENIKDGELSILIKPDQFNPRDSIRIGASMSIDHSISSQNFHSTESLNALVQTM